METNKLIYIVIALQIILIILCVSCFRGPRMQMRGYKPEAGSTMMYGMHMMPDGTMMSNSGSDMHSMMMDMTANMKGKKGAELEKVFLQDMIVHHEGAVDMAKELQKGTKRPELQKMAQDIITVQTKEISMMKGWLDSWFGIKQ